MPQKNLAVELLEKLLKDNIKAKTRSNIVQEKSSQSAFKKRFENTTTVR
jgi:hypothetical protein